MLQWIPRNLLFGVFQAIFFGNPVSKVGATDSSIHLPPAGYHTIRFQRTQGCSSCTDKYFWCSWHGLTACKLYLKLIGIYLDHSISLMAYKSKWMQQLPVRIKKGTFTPKSSAKCFIGGILQAILFGQSVVQSWCLGSKRWHSLDIIPSCLPYN